MSGRAWPRLPVALAVVVATGGSWYSRLFVSRLSRDSDLRNVLVWLVMCARGVVEVRQGMSIWWSSCGPAHAGDSLSLIARPAAKPFHARVVLVW